MKRTFKILFLFIFIVSCKNPLKNVVQKSTFNLKNDYTELTKKMTELDTILIYIDLSLLYHDSRQERLLITKEKDSLKISVSGSVGFELYDSSGNKIKTEYEEWQLRLGEKRQQEIFKVHKDDSIWNLDNIIKENSINFKEIDENPFPSLSLLIKHKKDVIRFNIPIKSDLKHFKKQYCQMMYQINPSNEFYEKWIEKWFSE